MTARAEFRRSQGVVPFGVGAMIDFKEDTLMAAGLDVWPTELTIGEQRAALLQSCRVVDGRLAERLTAELGRPIDFFLSPAEAPEMVPQSGPRLDRAEMPFVRFPNWYFCPRCRVLKEIPWNTKSAAASLKCDNIGRRVDGPGDPCGKLNQRRRPQMAPVRFVAACLNGHIMDFPWNAWAHKDASACCTYEPGGLYLYSTPAAGLAGVRVMCVKCKAGNSMAGAFRENVLLDVFSARCPGHRPWLGKGAEEDCTEIPQTIQRGASNAYFAKVVSSILIPPYSVKIRQVLDRPDVWEDITSSPLVDGKPHEPWLRNKAKHFGLDADTFVRSVLEKLQGESRNAPQQQSEARYRYDEYKAFLGPRPPKQEREDFDTEHREAGEYGEAFEALFEGAVLVRKLRETRVLTGFSRLVPPDATGSTPAKLSRKPKNWLPGFSVRGEGIFLQFRQSTVKAWAGRPDVTDRLVKIARRSDELNRDRGLPHRTLSAEALLIHTFSHLLIRQLAFECGYDSSSIRERLYVSTEADSPMAGVLLYTASGDSEGTLGGLVREGEPGRLDATITAGMRNAVICSSDPLCIESTGQGLYSLNLSACHACSLLPETSCEEGNLLLDRGLVIGTPSNPKLGYFAELI